MQTLSRKPPLARQTASSPRRELPRDSPLPPAQAPQTLTVAGHELTVFVESPPLFQAMLADIEAARYRVWLETYIFFNDEGGTRIAEALAKKAREGLDVRVMYDALGSAATPNAFFAKMQEAGIQVHAFHSLLEGLQRFRPFTILNRRNHRKLLVLDDSAGYFGGMNIIDNVENVRELKQENRPASSGWRDVHIRLAGPQQAELAESFERSWARAKGLHLPRRSRKVRRAGLQQIANEATTAESIRFFDSGPRDRYSRVARVASRLIRRARHQITISMAYFIPVGAVLRALLSARKRHVGVRVIVPGMSDVKVVQYASSYLYDRLIRRGIRVFERQHRMLHSKVMIVDDLYTFAGSANLDPRSFYTNLEFFAVIRSQPLARIMNRICRFEISQSHRITLGWCRGISRWQRVRNRLAWMLRWWL